VQRRLAHNGSPELRQHIQNANAKVQTDQDSTLRLCKRSELLKIDLAVAASMGVEECLRLLI
jgi:phage terminase large subunit-like protein